MEHLHEDPDLIQQLLARVDTLETYVQTLQERLNRVLEIDEETDEARLLCNSLTVRRDGGEAFLHAVADEDELYFGLVDGKHNNVELRLPLGVDEVSSSLHFYSAENLVARVGLSETGGEFVTLTRDQKPRTVCKAREESGIVAVLGDDGMPRVVLRDGDEGGIFEVLSKDHDTCAVIAAAPEGGAALTLRDNDDASTMLMAASGATSLLLGDVHTGVSLMHTANFSKISVGSDGAKTEISADETQARLIMKNDDDSVPVELRNHEGFGQFFLGNSSGQTGVALQAQESQASVVVGEAGARSVGIFANPQVASLGLSDEEGAPALLMIQDATHTNLMMCKSAGVPHMVLQSKRAERADEGAIFTILEDKHHFVARATPESAFLSLNQDNENVATLASHHTGGSLELRSAQSEPRVHLQGKTEGGYAHFMGETGGSRVSMGVAHDHGQLALSMSGGDIGVALGTKETGGQIMICDEEGQPIQTLPELEE